MAGFITEVSFWPDALDIHDPANEYTRSDWHLKVTYRGRDKFSIDYRGQQLSRAGNWYFYPQPFQRWQYRFTFEEAMDRAQEAANTMTIHGMNYVEFQEFFAAKDRARAEVDAS